MAEWQLRLALLPGMFAICRLPAGESIPSWADGGSFVSVTRTAGELSIVCPAEQVPEGVRANAGWRCLKVAGPFDLTSATGVLASLASPLADAGISLFAVATYDTDYILVQHAHLERVRAVLHRAGHTIID